MRFLFRISISFTLFAFLLQACQSNQPEPVTQLQNPSDSLSALVTQDDSLIKVTIPDFVAVINASVTPKGKLDRIITTYAGANPTSLTINFPYDTRQRIIGRSVLNSPSKGVDNAVIYEYKNDKPYRTFTKVIQPGGTSFYFMEQMVYDAKERHSAHLLYRVELDGQARVLERNTLIYDSANRLIEVKDPNGYHVGQLFDYKGDNMTLMSHKYANGTISTVKTEFQYDNKPNVLKGIYWTLNLGYIHQNMSMNNLLSRTFKDTLTTPQPTTYVTEYDTQNRLVRRSTTSSLGLVTDRYFFKN
ncbi:hypothetical protein GCM10028806_21010 [Spirosoma terrae]|uniref:DUF4595 domain-containing protein n=1 Tax=Spirosoma terrae TaxID=1968276 RepID=A0A6L9L740_9BACT|nr:hypothetical protein [Spirosoma terrae]NDU94583.1 hypothetical protein [Spirosoma terrae]